MFQLLAHTGFFFALLYYRIALSLDVRIFWLAVTPGSSALFLSVSYYYLVNGENRGILTSQIVVVYLL